MKHHTKRTVSAERWCGKCGNFTQHRVDDGRFGPCLNCLAKQENEIAERKAKEEAKGPVAKQEGLF